MGTLLNLRSLDAQYNALTSLPSDIGALAKLTELHLKYDSRFISLALPSFTLPADTTKSKVCLMSWETFLRLLSWISKVFAAPFAFPVSMMINNASGNRLETLPDTFSKLVNLQKLYANRNHFEDLPQCLAELSKLEGILSHLFLFFFSLFSTPSRTHSLLHLRLTPLCSVDVGSQSSYQNRSLDKTHHLANAQCLYQ